MSSQDLPPDARTFDEAAVTATLRLLDDTLTRLSELGGVDGPRLAAEPLTRGAVERWIQVAVDLAVDVNSHIAVTELDRAPASGRESFTLAARAGVIDEALAGRLGQAADLRDDLMYRFGNIDVMRVAEAIETVLDGFDAYVRQVAAHLKAYDGGGPSQGSVG